MFSSNSIINVLLMISMLVYTGYSERRITKMETIIESQELRLKKVEDSRLEPGEVMFRLNKIERTLEAIQHTLQSPDQKLLR